MEGRRSLKRKSDEDQMSERESRRSSVRAKISQDREWDDAGTNQSVEKKRFSFPGKTRGSREPPDPYHQQLIFSSGPKPRPQARTTDFEAHLQEVWSVRKNIHHKQQQPNPTTTNAGSKTSILQSGGSGPGGGGGGGVSLTQAERYSRHGAIPPQELPQQRHPQQRTRDTVKDSSAVAIETVTPWSLRKPSTKFNAKYSDPRPRPQQPAEMTSSSPAARLKGRGRGGEPAKICREDFEEPSVSHKREHGEKVDYAKTMAKGYLRSVGSGEYAPQQTNYVRDTPSPNATEKATKWKRTDSDEFDF